MAGSLTATGTASIAFNAQQANVGNGYTPPTAQGNPTCTVVYGTGSANNANNTSSNGINGADSIYSTITNVAANTNTTLNFQNLTNVFGAALNFARVKYIKTELLTNTQDPSGTTASSISIGNAATPVVLYKGVGTQVEVINNGASLTAEDNTAAGWPVNATQKLFLIQNNDVTNNASVRLTLIGGTT